MPKISRDEWLDWLQETRVGVAKLSDSDPRKADLQALLNDFEQIEKEWTEVDQHDPDVAAQLAKKIASIFKGD